MNWFRKKAVIVTMVGSLTLGLMGQAAFASTYSDTVTKIDAVHTQINTDGDATAVSNAETAFTGISQTSISGILGAIDAKIAASSDPTRTGIYAHLQDSDILSLFKETGVVFFGDSAGIADIKNNSANLQDTANELARLGSTTTQITLTADDFVDFFNAVEKGVQDNIESAVLTSGLNSATAKSLLKTQIEAVLNDHSYKVSLVMYNIGVTTSEIEDAYDTISAAVDSNNAVGKAIAVASLKTQITDTTTVTNSGRTVTPVITFTGSDSSTLVIPNSYLNWTKVSGTNVTMASDGTLTLDSSATSGSAEIKASLEGYTLYDQTLTLTYTSSNSSGGSTSTTTTTSASPTPTPTPAVTPTPTPTIATFASPDSLITFAVNTTTAEDLESLAIQYRNEGNGPGMAGGIFGNGDPRGGNQKAVDEVTKQIAGISVLTMSNQTKVSNNTAQVVVTGAQSAALFKSIKDNADTLNGLLKSNFPSASPAPITATINLGKQTADNTSISLDADTIQAAKDNSIANIAVKVNDLTLTVPTNELTGETTIVMNKKDASVATNITDQKVVSGVYQFEYTDKDGKAMTFKVPVKIGIPITISDGVNPDYMVLAKIGDDGKIHYYGGTYDKATDTFNAVRDSFSTYTVLEHIVQFNDTASVQSWAGDAIKIAAAKGIVQGEGDNNFAPNADVTRAEFIQMLVNTYQLSDPSATNSFSDVKATDWFSNAVSSAVETGIVNGETADTFAPNATITRAEMATMAARALEVEKGYQESASDSTALTKFNDANSINPTLTSGVALAASLGVVIGDNNNFDPNNSSTRAQAAVVISRLLTK